MKIFHYKEKLDSLPREDPRILAPLHVRLKPTNVCNHRCWYCAYRNNVLQLGKDMVRREQIPEAKMMELVDDFIEMGVKAITFSGGGEPFCYPHLAKTAGRLADAGIKFASLTNGSLLHGEAAKVFATRGSWVRVSIDGWDGKSYAEYRRVSEQEFGRVIGNLREFRKLSTSCYIGAVIIVDNKNYRHVYNLISLFNEIGLNSVKVAPCFISNSSEENAAYHAPHFQQAKEQIERAIDEFRSDQFEIFDSYYDQLQTFTKEYDWCPYLQIHPVVGADMNVYSCQDKAYNIDEGKLFSIQNNRFKTAWFENKSQFFKVSPPRHCAHHCIVNEKNKMILDYLNLDQDHKVFV
jgi:MoaA/NifB/PqqE/SkfB family radical SAM enzyme